MKPLSRFPESGPRFRVRPPKNYLSVGAPSCGQEAERILSHSGRESNRGGWKRGNFPTFSSDSENRSCGRFSERFSSVQDRAGRQQIKWRRIGLGSAGWSVQELIPDSRRRRREVPSWSSAIPGVPSAIMVFVLSWLTRTSLRCHTCLNPGAADPGAADPGTAELQLGTLGTRPQ